MLGKPRVTLFIRLGSGEKRSAKIGYRCRQLSELDLMLDLLVLFSSAVVINIAVVLGVAVVIGLSSMSSSRSIPSDPLFGPTITINV